MSIVSKTGDQGQTSLMYNRRVSKCHPRLEACGAVDELNAALGLARASLVDETARRRILAVQKQLVILMGELATAREDLARYQADGFTPFGARRAAELEDWINEIEARQLTFRDWVLPGENPAGAALDLSRTACRRAERRVCFLQEQSELNNPEILIYLNRLSDLLWLMARQAEGGGGNKNAPI